jgi:hypothetical protein
MVATMNLFSYLEPARPGLFLATHGHCQGSQCSSEFSSLWRSYQRSQERHILWFQYHSGITGRQVHLSRFMAMYKSTARDVSCVAERRSMGVRFVGKA